MIAAMSIEPDNSRLALLPFVLAVIFSTILFCLLFAHLGRRLEEHPVASPPAPAGPVAPS